jgi:hypothetical protein
MAVVLCRKGHEKVAGCRICKLCAYISATAWRKKHPEKNRQRSREHHRLHPEIHHARKVALKIEVLSHYGPYGELRCSWPDCDVADLDVLSLDHIRDDGALHRKTVASGSSTYLFVKREGFPPGFQTLCMNHQWKKELQRKSKRISTPSTKGHS